MQKNTPKHVRLVFPFAFVVVTRWMAVCQRSALHYLLMSISMLLFLLMLAKHGPIILSFLVVVQTLTKNNESKEEWRNGLFTERILFLLLDLPYQNIDRVEE